MGRGYGNIALSQSILSGTRRLGTGASVRSNAPRAASLTPAQIDAALTYTADPTQSDRIRVAMIDTMGGQNPATREQMTKAFADDAVLKEGPDVGMQVATTGAPQLYGAEKGVGH